jgi:hypothetical protein
MSRRCREDPEFALAVLARITTERGKAMFISFIRTCAHPSIARAVDDA